MKPYIYLLLVDGVPRYIGKGTGGRKNDHVKIAKYLNARRGVGEKVRGTKFHNRLAKALHDGSKITARILRYYNTDAEAFEAEVKAIAKRKGLWNELAGGNGLSVIEARRCGLKSHLVSKDRLKERYDKISTGVKRAWVVPEARANWINSFNTDDAKKRKGTAIKASWNDPVIREKRSKAISVARTRQESDLKFRERQKLLRKESRATLWANASFRAKITRINSAVQKGLVRERDGKGRYK